MKKLLLSLLVLLPALSFAAPDLKDWEFALQAANGTPTPETQARLAKVEADLFLLQLVRTYSVGGFPAYTGRLGLTKEGTLVFLRDLIDGRANVILKLEAPELSEVQA